MAKLTKRKIDTCASDLGREIRLWDDDPRGFGVRIKSTGVKTFFVQYRSAATDKKVRQTIGQFGRMTVHEARTEARKILGEVARGKDPAQEKRLARQQVRSTAVTVKELCDEYLRDALAGRVTYRGRPKKASTLKIDEGRIKRHIVPLLGHRMARDVISAEVEQFMHDVRLGKTATTVKTGLRGVARVTGGATTASRTVDLLGSIFSYAVRHGIRPDNPIAGLERAPGRKRDRILSPDEYRRLGEALDTLEDQGANQIAIYVFRVLALSGLRRNEAFTLRRDAVDAHRQCLILDDTKSGRQLRPVGAAAMAAIAAAPAKDANPFVFPAARSGGHLVGVRVFQKAVHLAKLEGVTPHTLRHGYASVALELGYSELTIAGILGHRVHSITSRYAHHVDRALVAAADRVSGEIARRMAGTDAHGTEVVELLSSRRG